MTRRAAAAAVLLQASLLAACSGDPQEEYCAVVTERQEDLSRAAAEAGEEGLLATLPILAELAEVAPRDIADEWDRLVGALGGLAEALAEAGVEPSEYDPAEPPRGLTEADRGRIEAAAEEVASQETLTAMSGVEQHARDVCGTPVAL